MKEDFNMLVARPLEEEVLYIQPSLKGVLRELEYEELWGDAAVVTNSCHFPFKSVKS